MVSRLIIDVSERAVDKYVPIKKANLNTYLYYAQFTLF